MRSVLHAANSKPSKTTAPILERRSTVYGPRMHVPRSYALLLSLSLAACAGPEQKFWSWFGSNSQELDEFEKHQEATFAQLTDELHKVSPELTFEFGPKENGTREFVVSADGNQSAFSDVKKLVDAAPKIAGWKIIAFRQRKEGLVIELPGTGVKLAPDTILFEHAPPKKGEKLDVKIYVPGRTEENHAQIDQAAFILLDSTLGEYDVETQLGAIDFLPLPPDTKGLKPLTELPKVVDANK